MDKSSDQYLTSGKVHPEVQETQAFKNFNKKLEQFVQCLCNAYVSAIALLSYRGARKYEKEH